MLAHKNPLSPTLAHYIEKCRLGQAIKQYFSLCDKQLELKAGVALISLKKNGLHKKAKAIYDIFAGCRAVNPAELDKVFEVAFVSFK
ncbi:MAG: hypothetical protein K8R50_05485 [Betaproteobacteria bacterium]|nr:hypothetical protein [Betaproteobacteria bacterium]MCX7194352.1 hypothetical protein [Pseudomonadota bacterium]